MDTIVQDFGMLFVLSNDKQLIEQVSDNLSHFFPCLAQNVLGKSLIELFETKYEPVNWPHLQTEPSSAIIIEFKEKETQTTLSFEFSCISKDEYMVVEVFPLLEKSRSFHILGSLSSTIERVENSKSLMDLCQVVVEEVQRLTGFDRVMLFRFDEEWNGTVVSEKRSSKNVPSYLNHRFPSSDIPVKARKILAEVTMRIIPDVYYKPSVLIPPKPLIDLDRTILKSPSKNHIEYLKMMKVGASSTISLIKEGNLWGMVACHHEVKREIQQSEKFIFHILSRVVSSLIHAKESVEEYQFSQRLQEVFEDINQRIKASDRLIDALTKGSPSLIDLNKVEGSSLALRYEGKWFIIGSTPTQGEILELIEWIGDQKLNDEVFITDSLQMIYQPSQKFKTPVSGVLAINFPYGDNFIIWFRPELIRTVAWAGDPDGKKNLKTWQEKVQFKSVRWKKSEIEVIKKIKRSVIEWELLKQYKEFEILADSVDHYIWVSSPDGTPEYYNRRWMEVTGLSNDFDNEVNRGGDLIHPDDFQRTRDLWVQAITKGTANSSELRIKTKEGNYQWIVCRVMPAKNEKGEVIKLYGSGINIDHIKKIEEDLKAALNIRDEFISMASHELKTPITSLNLLLEISYRSQKKANQISPYIERAIKELGRLRHLVDDLLDVSKISSGKMEIHFQQTDFNKILYEVLERYQTDSRIADLLPPFSKAKAIMVECDGFRIEQVLTNIISNALKYGDSKPVDIKLKEDEEFVEIAVKDQGPGIPAEDQSKIFERFERVGTHLGISGLGLGLYICKSIVDAHGGEIMVDSKLGEGTTFRVKLRKKIKK